MNLYLVRHGKALSAAEDAARPLSERGRRDAEITAKLLKAFGAAPKQILHSGKTRAEETAAIVARFLAPGVKLEQHKGLSPMDEPGRVAALVTSWSEDTMLVGHLPHMARLTSLLLAGDDEQVPVDFVTAAAACLTLYEGEWVLRAFVVPRLGGGGKKE
jgi:phosphohistidine phosphatase